VLANVLGVKSGLKSIDGETGDDSSVWTVERVWEKRNSLITDPPDGRMPPLTPDAKKRREAAYAGMLHNTGHLHTIHPVKVDQFRRRPGVWTRMAKWQHLAGFGACCRLNAWKCLRAWNARSVATAFRRGPPAANLAEPMSVLKQTKPRSSAQILPTPR